MPEDTDQREDRRVRRTKRYLYEAMLALIQEKDYDTITVMEIADRANIGRATFYLHYKDKQELLLDALSSEFIALRDTLLNLQDDPSRPIPVRMLFEHVADNAALYRVMLVNIGRTDVYFHTRDVIAQFVKIQLTRLRSASGRTSTGTKSDAATIPPEIAAVHIAGSLLNLVSWWLMNDQPHPPEHMETIFQMLVRDGVAKSLGLEDYPFA